MSDYLSHIVMRTINPQAVMQPRLVGLFEPPRPPEGPIFSADQEQGQEETGQQFERPIEQPSPRQVPLTHSEPTAPPFVWQPGVLEPRQPLQTGPLGELTSQRVQPGPDSTEWEGKNKEYPRQATLQPTWVQISRVPPSAQEPSQSGVISPKTAGDRAARSDSVPTLPPSPLGRSQDELNQPEPGTLPAQPLVMMPPQVPLPLNKASPITMPPTISRVEKPEPASVINVAIGRIEVRAVPPTAPAQQKGSPSQSKGSLEEYLKQRQGGGQ